MNNGKIKIENTAISFRPNASNMNSAKSKSEVIMQITITNLYKTEFPCTKSKRKYA
jgi:hypothetical protein